MDEETQKDMAVLQVGVRVDAVPVPVSMQYQC
jgi:hypothetical protein